MAGLIARFLAAHPWILERLLAWLEALGRKKLLVNFDGSIAVQRWYLFYLEEDDYAPGQERPWYTDLPNVYIHAELRLETPESSHRHAWNTASLILRGSYWEEVDGVLRYNATGTIARLKHEQHHRITLCEPGTVTLFAHGFRRGPWAFKLKPCATLCETCGAKYGACLNTFKETPYQENVGTPDSFRLTTWFSSNHPGLDKIIARRKRSLGRVRVKSRDEVMAAAARRLEA